MHGLQSIDWKSQSLDCEDEMIEIMWADWRHWERFDPNIKHICSYDCSFFLGKINADCLAGFAEIKGWAIPGPRCPGPGKYELILSKDPQWIEASSVAFDGTMYWARVSKSDHPGKPDDMLKIMAQARADTIASLRQGCDSVPE